MRSAGNDEMNAETMRLAGKYQGQGVCGTDLAGSESHFPMSGYRTLFGTARTLGIPFTIHAGEAAGVESMQQAVEFGARRIGHGIRAYNDAATRALLIERGVCLEFCPTSNLQTQAVSGVTAMHQYPIRPFLDDSVSVCINTDNMTVSGTTLSQEIQQLHDAGVITADDARKMVYNAVEHAFIGDTEKIELRKKVDLRLAEGR